MVSDGVVNLNMTREGRTIMIGCDSDAPFRQQRSKHCLLSLNHHLRDFQALTRRDAQEFIIYINSLCLIVLSTESGWSKVTQPEYTCETKCLIHIFLKLGHQSVTSGLPPLLNPPPIHFVYLVSRTMSLDPLTVGLLQYHTSNPPQFRNTWFVHSL